MNRIIDWPNTDGKTNVTGARPTIEQSKTRFYPMPGLIAQKEKSDLSAVCVADWRRMITGPAKNKYGLAVISAGYDVLHIPLSYLGLLRPM
jgi:hypothetical protein